MADDAQKKRFEPKEPKQLDAPKDDPITVDDLALCTAHALPKAVGIGIGKCRPKTHEDWKTIFSRTNPEKPTYVAIKGLVYDVTGNKAYGPDGPYKVFTGHDASRALAKSSTKPEDVSAQWEDLPDSEKKVLEDWITFFSKRYNVVGRVVS